MSSLSNQPIPDENQAVEAMVQKSEISENYTNIASPQFHDNLEKIYRIDQNLEPVPCQDELLSTTDNENDEAASRLSESEDEYVPGDSSRSSSVSSSSMSSSSNSENDAFDENRFSDAKSCNCFRTPKKSVISSSDDLQKNLSQDYRKVSKKLFKYRDSRYTPKNRIFVPEDESLQTYRQYFYHLGKWVCHGCFHPKDKEMDKKRIYCIIYKKKYFFPLASLHICEPGPIGDPKNASHKRKGAFPQEESDKRSRTDALPTSEIQDDDVDEQEFINQENAQADSPNALVANNLSPTQSPSPHSQEQHDSMEVPPNEQQESIDPALHHHPIAHKIQVFKPSEYTIKKWIIKLEMDIKNVHQTYVFWSKTTTSLIGLNPKPKTTHSLNNCVNGSDESGFRCLSLFITGTEENHLLIKEKIRKLFFKKYKDIGFFMGINFQELTFESDPIENMILSVPFNDVCCQFISQFLHIRIGVFEGEVFKKFGNWSEKKRKADIPTFLIELKNGSHQIVLSINNEN